MKFSVLEGPWKTDKWACDVTKYTELKEENDMDNIAKQSIKASLT